MRYHGKNFFIISLIKFQLFTGTTLGFLKKTISQMLLKNSLVRRLLSHNDSKKCPICCSKDIDYFFANGRFRIYHCLQCSHKFVGNTWSNEKLNRHYQGDIKWHLDRNHQGIYSVENELEWRVFLNARWDALISNSIIEELQNKNIRCLEIGCAEGKFLSFLKEKGYDVIGCEVNEAISKLGQEKLGLEIINKPIEDCNFDSGSFDIICSFHVFEHLRDPINVLKLCRRLLKVNGKILLELPIGDEELTNRDHLHFFSVASGRFMIQKVFNNVWASEDSYVTSKGIRVGSVYLTAQNIEG